LYRQAIDQDKNNLVALNNLVWLLAMQSGRPAEAKTLIDQGIAKAGPLPTLLDTRGTGYLKMNQPALAANDFEEVSLRGPPASPFLRLAQARLGAGDRWPAAEALRKAKELGLEANVLHPLERKDYDTVLSELERK